MIVLVVEDNYADVLVIKEALRESRISAVLHVVHDGEAALAFINEAEANAAAPCPNLLLLDLNLPRKGGIEILERIRRSPKCGHTPVIIVSSSDSPQDRELTMRLGATRYFRKPMNLEQFMKLGELVKQVLEEPRGIA